MGKRAENAAKARTEILMSAHSILEKSGIQALSIREIAKHMGVSPMMPYSYFASKDHILMELRLAAFAKLSRKLRNSNRKSENPDKSFRNLIHTYLMFSIDFPNEYRLMFEVWEFENYDEISRDFGESIKRVDEPWEENRRAIEALIRYEDLDLDAVSASHWVWATLHGLAHLNLSNKLAFGRTIEDLGSQITDYLIWGLRARGTVHATSV